MEIMQLLPDILSYVLFGGLVSVITALVTLRATKRSANADAKKKEEEAEAQSIKNDSDKLELYDKIIGDLNGRLVKMMNRVAQAESETESALRRYTELKDKYDELEGKYNELEQKYNQLKNPSRPGAVRPGHV